MKTEGIGFLGFLTLLFIGLKLGGVLDWSWWYVLLPLWWPLAFVVGVVLLFFLIFLIMAIYDFFNN